MGHHDLLDVAEATLLEPLESHPEELRKFRDETLYAPLEGSVLAKKRAKANALAAMGVDINAVKAGTGMGRQAKRIAAKAESKGKPDGNAA